MPPTPAEHERQLGPHQADAGPVELGQGALLREVEQLDRGVERARLELGDRSRQRSLSALLGIQGEGHGALEEGARCCQTAPRLGAAGRALELIGDVLVRPGTGMREVPAAPVRIEGAVGLRSKCPVHPLTFRHGR
ncbi:MAG TPA: hypothetical protein VGO89_18915 [Streptomyces sp.]|nr:hypothetical protein [Streptomyces sp.]